MPGSNSLVTVYRASDKKLLRYEDNEGKTIANVQQGRLKVTSWGIEQGYYVNPDTGKLFHEGYPVSLSKIR